MNGLFNFGKRLAVGLLWLQLLVACAEDKTIVVPLELHAKDTEGRPLADVQVWANGRALGRTEADGRLETRIRSVVGKQVTLTRTCPQGFEAEDQSRTLRIAETHGINQAQTALQLRFQCRSAQLLAALVVRAPNPLGVPLPITVAGQVVGQTDTDGIGHVLLRVLPDSTVRVELNTSDAPDLSPHNPVRTFQMHDTAQILRFDQPLEKPAPAARPRHIHQPALMPEQPHLPKRIR